MVTLFIPGICILIFTDVYNNTRTQTISTLQKKTIIMQLSNCYKIYICAFCYSCSISINWKLSQDKIYKRILTKYCLGYLQEQDIVIKWRWILFMHKLKMNTISVRVWVFDSFSSTPILDQEIMHVSPFSVNNSLWYKTIFLYEC